MFVMCLPYPLQEHATLLVERNTVSSLSVHVEDLKESKAQLANALSQVEAHNNRLRSELDEVRACLCGGVSDPLRGCAASRHELPRDFGAVLLRVAVVPHECPALAPLDIH